MFVHSDEGQQGYRPKKANGKEKSRRKKRKGNKGVAKGEGEGSCVLCVVEEFRMKRSEARTSRKESTLGRDRKPVGDSKEVVMRRTAGHRSQWGQCPVEQGTEEVRREKFTPWTDRRRDMRRRHEM